jgi:HlyD family secretion protein
MKTLLKKLRWPLAALATLIVVAWGGFVLWNRPAKDAQQYAEQALKRGDLAVNVTATGTLQPTNTVEVGSELSGTIAKVFVDYNDTVKKGQVLAVLDTSKLLQTIDKSRAALAAKRAAVAQVRATLKEAEVTLARQEEVHRASNGKVPSATELDSSRAKVERARADLDAAQASVTEAAATLSANETDLSKATIRSPTDGVVLTRSIEPGQTVAASMSTPVLFTLAEDLAAMELIVSVSEADVGQVRNGQKAQFNVDAFPGKNYPATIRQVRFGSKTVDNVVSYETVLTVKNQDLSLRPGMTASADILVRERKDVLLAPNTALRFKPQAAQAKSSGGVVSMLLPRPPGGRQPAKATESGRRQASAPDEGGQALARATLWVKTAEGGIKSVNVLASASDGKFTEIRSRELKAGDSVITSMVAKNHE